MLLLACCNRPRATATPCDLPARVLDRLTGGTAEIVSRFDPDPEFNVGPRPGCGVSFDGRSSAGAPTFDSLLATLQASGWRPAPRFRSDGVGTSLAGVYRDGVTCLLEAHADISDDEQGAYAPADRVRIRIGCAAGEPEDSL